MAIATEERPLRPFLPRWITFGVMPFMLAMSIAMASSAYIYVHSHQGSQAISARAELMGLSDLPGQAAPAFSLTDQHGRQVTLSDFRGKAVLLTFMDTQCTEICPVIAQEILLARRDLGAASSKVAFVAVNVNPNANSVSAVEHFSQIHGLAGLSNWYFLTGSAAALRAVWKEYNIQVIVPKGRGQTTHAAYMYFIGPRGHGRYLASPQADQRSNGTGYLPQPTLAQWGQDIAHYLRKVSVG